MRILPLDPLLGQGGQWRDRDGGAQRPGRCEGEGERIVEIATGLRLLLGRWRPQLALAGSGHAEKHEVLEAVMRELALESPPRPDAAADALAVALTGWFQR